MIFRSSQKVLGMVPELKLGSNLIVPCDCVQFLGIILDTNLKFTSHVDHIRKKWRLASGHCSRHDRSFQPRLCYHFTSLSCTVISTMESLLGVTHITPTYHPFSTFKIKLSVSLLAALAIQVHHLYFVKIQFYLSQHCSIIT